MSKIIQVLKNHFGEHILTPDSSLFKRSCFVINAHVKCETNAIVNCQSEKDIARALKIARDHDIPISVASGRQSFMDKTFLKPGITLDVSALKRIHINVDKKILTTQAAATSVELMKALEKHSLVLPLGTGKNASIAGYTLPGGLSNISLAFGTASDLLKEVTLVDCNGTLLKASQNENPDLFWALRGGGEHFGITTSLTFDLKVIAQKVLAGFLVYPVRDFKQVGSVIIEKMVKNNLPDNLNIGTVLLDAKMVTDKFMREIGEALVEKFGNSQFLLVPFTHFGELGQAQKDINSIRNSCGKPFFQHINAFDYWDHYAMAGERLPKKWSVFLKQYFIDHTRFDLSFLDHIAEAIQEAPAENFFVDIHSFGGKVNERDPSEMAFFHRKWNASITFGTKWLRKREADMNINYVRESHQKIKPYLSDYSYKPFGDVDLVDWNKAYYGDNYARLLGIKQKRDSENVFRKNVQDLIIT